MGQKKCRECDGSGSNADRTANCGFCGGSGRVSSGKQKEDKWFRTTSPSASD